MTCHRATPWPADPPLVIRANEPGTRGVTVILPFAEMCAKSGHQLLAWNRDSREATLVWGRRVLDCIKGDLNGRIAHAHVYGNWVVLAIDFMPPATVWLRPNYPREPTFATERPLFRVFVGCTLRYGHSRWCCR